MPETKVQLFPYLFQPGSGPPVAAEWGQLLVPENRQAKDSRFITIPFVRFRCTSNHPGPPIIFLQGGPGESLLHDLHACWDRPMWRPPLHIADFIFIEQRGSGISRPCLDCPGTYQVPLDEAGSFDLYLKAHRHYLIQAVTFWQEQGIDLNGYNVLEMAADINDLRQALGYEKISLLGGSFGSHHGFTLLRYYEAFIERAFLFSIEGPNHTLKLPGQVQKQLEKLNERVQDDSNYRSKIPDLLELMASVLDRLEQKKETIETNHPQKKEKVMITLGKYDLQLVTAKGMGSTSFLKALPMRYLAMKNGDFSWLAEQTISARIGVKSNLMYEATDCASGATMSRKERIIKASPTTLLGNAINEPFHHLCDIIGNKDLGDQFRRNPTIDTPTLLACGSLDARTPISNAEELLPHFPKGQLLTVDGVSHDLSLQGGHIEAFARCRDRFFSGEAVEGCQLKSTFVFD